ncbi:carbonic anhydrase [Algihabitans albus]|uniref:hypothetical protein n=1 Tax=Algihabitans albus TaxID=2164067 RepID=UPI0013C32BBF|nr:hypothetical protein [Algihabitans albus]
MIDSVRTHANDDTIQSLVTSHKQLGTRDLFVVRQADSREEAVDEVMHAFLAESLNVEQNDTSGFAKGQEADWLTLSDPTAAVAADILRIRSHPDMPDDARVHGYLYDRNGERLIRLDI